MPSLIGKERLVFIAGGAAVVVIAAPVARWTWTEGLMHVPLWATGFMIMGIMLSSFAILIGFLMMGWAVLEGHEKSTDLRDTNRCESCDGTGAVKGATSRLADRCPDCGGYGWLEPDTSQS